jgi:hypothetical protein
MIKEANQKVISDLKNIVEGWFEYWSAAHAYDQACNPDNWPEANAAACYAFEFGGGRQLMDEGRNKFIKGVWDLPGDLFSLFEAYS